MLLKTTSDNWRGFFVHLIMGLVLKINDRFRNRKVDVFNSFSFELKFNAVGSVFGFSMYFDPSQLEHKELSCVSHYHEVTLEHNGELLLTGQITDHNFTQSAIKHPQSITGYSLPGALEDCTIPPEVYPLQSDGLSLAQITQKLIKPFKLSLVIDESVESLVNTSFETTTASETQTVKAYLHELAKQKDIIMTHDEFGNLLYTKAKTDSAPIFDFDLTEGSPVGHTFSMSYKGRGLHSHITVQKEQSIDGGNSGQTTIRNPYVVSSPNVFRPKTISQTSGTDDDTVLAAKRALASELRNVGLTISISGWDINNKIIKPNNIITIIAPELYIFRKERFFIESVSFTGNESQTTAVLNCVLPEVYTNDIPVNIYRGINLHAIGS